MSSSAAEDATSQPREARWLVFVCDERRFGFPLERVSEILAPRQFTRLPGTGPEVCGLAGVHGRVVTVIDLGVVLGLRSTVRMPDHRLLLLDLEARQIGVVVEEVAAITRARIERRDSAEAGTAVLGTGLAEEGEFAALEPQRLLHTLLAT